MNKEKTNLFKVLEEKCNSVFIKGTDVGFDSIELKSTSTAELNMIRKSINLYLISKKQKKRNSNFKDLYNRIGKELKERHNNPNKTNLILKEINDLVFPSFLQDKKKATNLNKEINKKINAQNQLNGRILFKFKKLILVRVYLIKNMTTKCHKKILKIIKYR